MSERLPGPVACVCGPTASGKSAVADLVASSVGCPVVSVDAMQVYRSMDIGTAKTPASERAAELLMVDVAGFDEPYSVALFQRDARACVDRSLARHGCAVLCGGTGLYLDAVIDDMDFPAGDAASKSRARYEALANEQGPQALWDLLRQRDPKSAEAVHPHNVRRVVRALELADQGASYAERTRHLRRRKPRYDALIWALVPERDALYARIDARVDEMFSAGLVDEVKALADAGIRKSPTASQAIGYKEVLAALDGQCTLDEAKEAVKRSTRRYAKRQLSWIKRDGRATVIPMGETSPEQAAWIIEGQLRRSREARR
ncbi:tRNA (adenosine(37)-N6)-dimethylallyltransferase MiaA [Atopobiaceae bacterium 24-176]